MTSTQRFTSVLAVLLFALFVSAQAQTPSIEVTTDSDKAQFSTQGTAQQMRVEVYAPSGELVFESDASAGQFVEWSMRDNKGARVADGVYLVTISITDATGKARKRVEQITVSNGVQGKETLSANAPPPDAAVAPIDGEGTTGKIAKFTGTNAIGNSIIAESASKIGIGTTATPTARLQINGAQPAPQPANGTEATPLLQTSGGKGGNTTTAGEIAGRGASISLLAGNGGDAHADSTNGSGGNITLQPGSPGTGGTGGVLGKVLIAPTGGNVGIGTTAPTARLMVKGVTSPNLVSVENTSATFGSVAVFGKSSAGYGISGSSSGGFDFAGVYGSGPIHNNGVLGRATGLGIGVIGQATGSAGVYGESSGLYGVYGKTTSSTSSGVHGEGHSTGVSGSSSGWGVYGSSSSGNGVRGFSSTGHGVHGRTNSGYAGYFEGTVKTTGTIEIGGTAFFGSTTRQMLHLYSTSYGIGVQSSTQYFRSDFGFAWYKGGAHNNTQWNPGSGGAVLMRLDGSGNLVTTGAVNPSSDRHMKSNFSPVNPRFILDRLAAIPIQTWNYKAEGNSVRHIGPVSQDFRAAFNLGADDKHISTVDADGVTMAAIQGLYQMMLEKEKKNEQLASEVQQLRAQVAQLERAMKQQHRGRRAKGR